jgi:hypothetical protein
LVNQVLGKDGTLLQRLSIGSPHYDPRVGYLLGFPTAIALGSAVYQYLATGEPPHEVKDLAMPKTGGRVAGYAQRNKVDERLLWPGFTKDVLGWVNHPFTEAYNKLNGIIPTAYETARGVDGLGRPFVDPRGGPVDQVVDRWHYLAGKLGPISLRSYAQGQKQGSNIPPLAAAVGFRSPSAEYQDPEGYRMGELARMGREYSRREKSVRRIERQYAPYEARP